MVILPDKHDPSSEKKEDEYLFSDDLFSAEFPGLYEYLARVLVAGKSRAASRLIVYGEAGRVCLCLTDPHSAQVAFHSGEGFSEALEALERRLQEGKVDWRKDRKARYSR